MPSSAGVSRSSAIAPSSTSGSPITSCAGGSNARQIDSDAYRAAEAGLPILSLAGDELHARVEHALGGHEPESGDRDLLRDCVLEMEQLAGLEPPTEDRQRRMDLQLEKLSARMRGVHAPAPDVALQNLLGEWVQLGPVASEVAPLETRFKRALNAALDTLG